MLRVEQIENDFRSWHFGFVCEWQFHFEFSAVEKHFRHLTPALSPFEAEREKSLRLLRSFAAEFVFIGVHSWFTGWF